MKPANKYEKPRHREALRTDTNAISIQFYQASRSNDPSDSSKATLHAAAFVEKRGRITPRDYCASTGMTVHGALTRLRAAERAGLIRSTGEGGSLCFERIGG